MTSISKRFTAWLCVLVLPMLAMPAAAQMRITEFMYGGANGEFVEFTNVGDAPVDMTGWSFDDDSRNPGTVDLSAFGAVAPGESVILTETAADAFRAAWSLCDAVKVIGGNATNLGREDEINLFDASSQLVDRLTYGDDTIGGPRANGASAWVSADGLGANNILDWTLSAAGDAEHSFASTGGDIGSPGSSTRAGVVFTACPATAGVMRITEYMYQGGDGEFIEFTNVGGAPIDMTGWSFDDDSRNPGTVDLSAFGAVAAGESVVLTESDATNFRAAWSLCDAVKVIGGNATNLGREDEINLFNATGQLADRLTYGDDTIGGPRANGASAWVSADGLGANNVLDWTLSTVGDAEASILSAGGAVGSPGRSTRASVPFDACPTTSGAMRITEYMYAGTNGEFVEFTNVGETPVDMTGWSFSDDAETPGAVDLGAYGSVAPGESVILTETPEADFRDAWHLCAGYKIIGGNTVNLSRGDEINLYDASAALVDRLTYDDQTLGGPRTNGASAWVSAEGLGQNNILDWTLSTFGDAEASVSSTGADVGSPGRSTRAIASFDPCADEQGPVLTVDALATSIFLDLPPNGPGTVSGVVDDLTDPANTQGIGFHVEAPAGEDPNDIVVTAESSNAGVVDDASIVIDGQGDSRHVTITPHGVGYATITLRARDPANLTGTYVIHYAASAAPADPADTVFHTGASDASATIAIDDDCMFVADDETNVLRLYDRHHSGLPLNGFDFSANLGLTDPDNPELDIEGSAEIGQRVFWTTSFSNSKNFHVRPNRHRVFATDLAAQGVDSTLSYVGRYDWLLEDLVAWDESDGHGLGANYLGFAASSAEGVDSKTPEGFNIEGLAMAPDGTTAYFAFRAPLLPTNDRHQAVIVPVLGFADLVTGAAPGSRPQGSATFGAPIFLDLGGRGIRSLDRNAAGQYLVTAGPTGDATGVAPFDFRLYAWTGNPADAPFDLGVDMTALDVNDGSFESIAGLPDVLGANTELQFLLDNGDSIWYGDGIAAKDLPDARLKKAASLRVTVDAVFPAASLIADCCGPQSTIVHHPFPAPTSVRVVDAYGNGVPNVTVDFSVPASGASAELSATSVETDAQGYVTITMTANAIAGTYDLVASVDGVAGTASYALTNLADVASAVEASGGTPQSAVVDQAFAAPLGVHVTDSDGNAKSGVTVHFAAPSSGASATLSAATAVTDANGDASVEAFANAIAGSYEVVASVDGVAATASFALTNLPDVPSTVAATGGTPQSAVVGQPFAAPLGAHVADANGNAESGVTVHFTAPSSGASATLSAAAAVTDANGDASVTATANTIAGGYSVVASVDGVAATASFALTNTPGAVAAIDVASGDGQSTVVMQAFAEPLAVRLRDADGNAVPGVTVQFLAPASGPGATLSSTSVVTDANGEASVTATANAIAGSFSVAATFDALQATFSLTNLPGAASVIEVAGGTPQSAIVGQPFAAPLAVHVTDAFGNAAPGAGVTYAAPASGASAVLSATTVTTDANGDASVTATANAIEGSYAVTAGIDAGDATATFALTNTLDLDDVVFRDGFDP